MTPNDPINDHFSTQLLTLGESLQFPDTPELSGMIADEIRSKPAIRHQYAWIAITATIVMAALTTPPGTDAMRSFLDVIGIEIQQSDGPQGQQTLDLLDATLFGEPMSLDRAERAFPGDLRFPAIIGSDGPDDIYAHTDADGLVSVTFVYGASDDLPEIEGSGIGLILTQISAPADQPYLIKRVFPDQPAERVMIENSYGYWIPRGGLSSTENPNVSRSSANVLVWMDGITGYRLESNLTHDQAIDIAISLLATKQGNQVWMPPVIGTNSRRF